MTSQTKRLTNLEIGTLPWAIALSILVTPCGVQAAAGRIGVGAEGTSHVKAFTSRSQTNVMSFFAYGPSFQGGVRVAIGDVNNDGAADLITAVGPGAGPHVKAFSGRDGALLASFFAYDTGFVGGIYVAAGDVTGDGFDDVITGTDAGARGHVKVFDGLTGAEVLSFHAFPDGFLGGVRVAAGDVNGDGRADIIVAAGPGTSGYVKVIDGTKLAEIHTFSPYGNSFAGGVFVGSGDVNGDGFADIITGAGSGAGSHVKVFDGQTGSELQSFFAYPTTFSGGVRVAAGDLDGDGRAEIITGPGAGAQPHVKVFDGKTGKEASELLAYAAATTNGVFVSVASVKRPQLELRRTRAQDEIQLQWPSGCLCELEWNSEFNDPRGWKVPEGKLVETGNRIGLLLPAVQKVQFFRLKCDEEAVR